MKICLMAGIGKNNELGVKGNLPWKLKEDLKLFKKETSNYPLVMGRKTFDSLPGVLPGRKHYVLTRTPDTYKSNEHVKYLKSLEEVLKTEENNLNEKIFIIGGGEIYEKYLDQCDELYISHIDALIESADTFFPKVDYSKYDIIKKLHFLKNEVNQYNFDFCLYRIKKD
jgi:dihydrofolate reductase